MARKKIEKKDTVGSGDEIDKIIKVIIVVTIIFLLFLLITYLVTKKDQVKKTEEEVKIQYNNVMVGQLLTRGEDQYYVLVNDHEDNYLSLYEYYLSVYNNDVDSLRIYKLELNHPFNKPYVGEISNLKVGNKIEDIKFTSTTLLKIKNKKIELAIDTKEEIIDYLEKLTK